MGAGPAPTGTHVLSLLFPLKDGGCTCPGDVAKAFGKDGLAGGGKALPEAGGTGTRRTEEGASLPELHSQWA